jgi:colanic acid biosynthesis glycosyl transferase WcaI
MRILISDYSGHPFQVQLSRELARRGHNVRHVVSSSFQTPKGRLAVAEDDPPSFSSVGVRTRVPFAKDSFLKRRSQEIEIGKRIAEQISEFGPDLVISSNAPLDTLRVIERQTRRSGARFVFWVQDIYSHAIFSILSKKFKLLGRLIGHCYRRLEARIIRSADHNVVIAPEFVPALISLAGIDPGQITLIENWAPLDEIEQHPRDNAWAATELPPAPLRFIYSGTLGFKHDPGALLALAQSVDGDVLVFSEGEAATQLAADAQARNVTNLSVRPWVPFEYLPEALASADVLIVILEADAGAFSVPSKVLTYMCVGRPILASVPAANLSARLIAQNEAGLVAEAGDVDAFLAASRRLADDPALRVRLGRNARSYAERAFDIDEIANKFEQVISKVLGSENHAEDRTGLRSGRVHRQSFGKAPEEGRFLGPGYRSQVSRVFGNRG